MGAMKDYLMEQAQQDADDQETCEDCGAEMDFILGDREHIYYCPECLEAEHDHWMDTLMEKGELTAELHAKLKRK